MDTPVRKRFLALNVSLIAVIVILAVLAVFRQRQWRQSGIDLRNQAASLSLAVGSLRSGTTTDQTATEGFRRLTGGNKAKTERLMKELKQLDAGISTLLEEGRIRRRCYLDLDDYCKAIDVAKGLIGTRWDIALEGLARLRRGQVLHALQWADDMKPGERTGEYWHRHVARLPEGILKEKNPWGALPGRVLVESNGGREYLMVGENRRQRSEGAVAAVNVSRRYPGFSINGMGVIEQELLPWLAYDADKSHVARGNRVPLGNKQVNAGYDVVMTIDPSAQELSRRIVESILRRGDVAEATIVSMDVGTGEILSAFGADNSGREQHPDSIPLIFQIFPLASTSKIEFAAALLEHADEFAAATPGAKAFLAGMPGALKRSDTAWFQRAALDFNGSRYYLRQAKRLGWNRPPKSSLEFCFGSGFIDSARDFPMTGRMLVEPDAGGGFRELSDSRLAGLPPLAVVDRAIKANRPPAGFSTPAYNTARIVRTQVAGQGDARISAWGELLMVSQLASAANGASEVPLPHLVRRVLDVKGKPVDSAPKVAAVPAALSTSNAQKLVGYLNQVNARGGTAAAEFQRVFGRSAGAADKIFAKTGTTDERFVPYKLYVAGYARGMDFKGYDTALVAVVKRNKLPGGGYSNANPAAEMGLEFIRLSRQKQAAPQ